MTNEYDYNSDNNVDNNGVENTQNNTVETIHNTTAPVTNVNTETHASMTPTGQRLRAYIDRIERLDEDKQAVMEDMKEVFAEAKGDGFDVKAMRKIISMRKKDPSDRAEEEAILDTYLAALGMV